MKNTKIIYFKDIVATGNGNSNQGHLTPIESSKDIPFDIKRLYYITSVPEGVTRGYHSHRDLEQVLICMKGSVCIKTSTPFEQEEVLLDSPFKGLYIGPMVWREMSRFSEDSVLVVLASRFYDEKDYIREYEQYEVLAKEYFDESR